MVDRIETIGEMIEFIDERGVNQRGKCLMIYKLYELGDTFFRHIKCLIIYVGGCILPTYKIVRSNQKKRTKVNECKVLSANYKIKTFSFNGDR